MLRFPATHRFAQFAGYPGHFTEMDDVLRAGRREFPEYRHVGDPALRIFGECRDNEHEVHETSTESVSRLVRDQISFWPGFCGGGILAVPSAISPQDFYAFLSDALLDIGFRNLYGTWLGNRRPLDPAGYAAGEELREHLFCVEPSHVPALAVRYGLAAKVPEPTVKVTIEHLSQSDDDRWLLVVPKATRKRALKFGDRLPEWFRTFGVDAGPAEPVSDELRTVMSDWFDDPQRPMWRHRLEGGIDDAAWQLGVVNYVADHWSIQERGLDSVHLLATVEREPGFRRYWTSNR